MIRDIVMDKNKLSEIYVFNVDYEVVVSDLIDTANFNIDNYMGLAANQIDSNNRVIVIKIGGKFMQMCNPKFIRKYKSYGFRSTNEGCLSFPGVKTKIRRYKKILVSYFDPINTIQYDAAIFTNRIAKIFQHEMDHLNGILI